MANTSRSVRWTSIARQIVISCSSSGSISYPALLYIVFIPVHVVFVVWQPENVSMIAVHAGGMRPVAIGQLGAPRNADRCAAETHTGAVLATCRPQPLSPWLAVSRRTGPLRVLTQHLSHWLAIRIQRPEESNSKRPNVVHGSAAVHGWGAVLACLPNAM